MERFSKYKIGVEREDETKTYGSYSIAPLQSGFGITIGNALRRILLSNIPGAAVFAVKASSDVTQEFQAIDGVTEDMTQIVLNLKNLIVRVNDEIVPDDKLDQTPIEQ